MRTLLGSVLVVSITLLGTPGTARAHTQGWEAASYDLAGTRCYPLATTASLPSSISFQPAFTVPGNLARTSDLFGDGHLELVVQNTDSISEYGGQGNLIRTFSAPGANATILGDLYLNFRRFQAGQVARYR